MVQPMDQMRPIIYLTVGLLLGGGCAALTYIMSPGAALLVGCIVVLSVALGLGALRARSVARGGFDPDLARLQLEEARQRAIAEHEGRANAQP